jgi:putative acetyltransferase
MNQFFSSCLNVLRGAGDSMITIRQETKEDRAAVHHVNEVAFGRVGEAALVDALREVAHPHISLVATLDDQVVGHIFFSPVSIESDDSVLTALGLAPMAVLPEYQSQGIGSALVREGLKECQRIGHNIVVVLGHPEYYPRFGFIPAIQKGLRCEYQVPDEAFMVLELIPDALKGRRGLVKYHPAFSSV